MLSKRLIKRHRELQEILERLFNPTLSLDPRTRKALERRAEVLLGCLHDVDASVLEQRKKLQKLAESVKKRKG